LNYDPFLQTYKTIVSSAASGSLLVGGSGTASNLPAYFIDINTERTRVVEQSSGVISSFALLPEEDTNMSLRDV